MSTLTAPPENGFHDVAEEGASTAKRIKLSPPEELKSSAEITLSQPAKHQNDAPTTNCSLTATENLKDTPTCGKETERTTVAENGHHLPADQEKVAVRRNQDGEISSGYVSTEDWKKKWERGKTRFHMGRVHGMLKKHFEKLVEGKDSPRILVPLCGKTVDMIWLNENGCSVVGCEVVELGVQQFFIENKLEYTTEPLKDTKGTVYKAKDKDITIYCTDFFGITSAFIGRFDCVWDRGSLAAINPDDRKRYRDVIVDLLKPGGRCLLDVFEVPHDVFSGPPHNLNPEEVTQLFGGTCNIQQLEHVNAMNPWTKTWEVSYFYENDFLLTVKEEN